MRFQVFYIVLSDHPTLYEYVMANSQFDLRLNYKFEIEIFCYFLYLRMYVRGKQIIPHNGHDLRPFHFHLLM